MKYKCIIFDCDGVLVDSELIANKTIVEMAKEIGVHIEMEYAVKFFSGISLQHTISYIEQKLGHKLPKGFEENFRKRTYSAFKTHLQPVNGVIELLEKINVPMCVASSGPLEKLQLSLSVTGLIKYFENKIFSSYEIGRWKPQPDIFLYAAQKMGFTPTDCAVVEDSLAGVEAAMKGGFDVFCFAQHGYENELQKRGATVFKTMSDLYPLLS